MPTEANVQLQRSCRVIMNVGQPERWCVRYRCVMCLSAMRVAEMLEAGINMYRGCGCALVIDSLTKVEDCG